MRPIHRKLARALKRLATDLGRQPIAAAESIHSAAHVASIGPARTEPDRSSARGCPACGADAGIRHTRDMIRGELAGECTRCGALRLID